MSSEVINRIELQLQKYFDGLYFSDVARLKTVFMKMRSTFARLSVRC